MTKMKRASVGIYIVGILCVVTLTTCGASPELSEEVIEVLGKELSARTYELGEISDSEVHRERTFLGPAWAKAAELVTTFMEEAGLETWMDGIGNIHGRTPAAMSEDAPALLVGSHFDTIIDAGAYDGPLGVLTSIAATKAVMLDAKASGAKLIRPVEVIAFGDEEGVRFVNAPDIFLCSEAVAGSLIPKGGLGLVDDKNITLGEALNAYGLDGSEEAIANTALDPSAIHAFVELHIEQGPVLESMNRPVGVVSAINGMTGFGVRILGKQGHAGTSRMDLRKDSLAAAAEAIVMIENVCASHEEAKDKMLVCTVGRVLVEPSVSNVISGDVYFTVDMRAMDYDILSAAVDEVRDRILRLGTRRSVTIEFDKVKPVVPPVHMDAAVSAKLAAAVEAAGVESDSIWGDNVVGGSLPERTAAAPFLPSGANHDCGMMAKITNVGMLWTRCKDGISHSPLEHVDERDIAEGALALYRYVFVHMHIAHNNKIFR